MIMGTKSRKRTAVLCVACLSAAVLGISLLYPITLEEVSMLRAPVKASVLPGTQLASGQTMISADFSTHLPIVVIDIGEQEPKSDSVWDLDKEYKVLVDDPYAEGYIYLLMENAERSKNRVDVPAYRPNQTLSYILRRDRHDQYGIMLNAYGEQSGLVQGFLEVKYPSADKVTERDVERIRNEVSAFEQALFAEDPETFLTYPIHIDMDTFIDYFIINELFMNYDAGYNSTYLHKGHTAKLTMGPFWDFDRAMATDREFVNRMDSTAFHDAPWFRQLLRDPNFTTKLVNRYHELRQGSLSSVSIDKLVDDTVGYLGTAAQRDWSRWQYAMTTPPGADGSVPVSFYDEAKQVRDILTIHGAWLDKHIDSLYQFSDPSISVVEAEEKVQEKAQEKADLYSDLMAVLYIAVFLISVILIRRET